MIWFIDATFSVVPSPFCQVLAILVSKIPPQKYVRLACILMENKDEIYAFYALIQKKKRMGNKLKFVFPSTKLLDATLIMRYACEGFPISIAS